MTKIPVRSPLQEAIYDLLIAAQGKTVLGSTFEIKDTGTERIVVITVREPRTAGDTVDSE